MDRPISSPSANDFQLAFIAFILAASSVAFLRGSEFGPKRMAHIAKHLAHEFARRFSIEDAIQIMKSFEDDHSRNALGTLFEEFIYVACRYRQSARDAGIELVIPGEITLFDGELGNAFSKDAVEEIETVKSSISRLLEKLPKWAQRIIEALMEALKLTRGITE